MSGRKQNSIDWTGFYTGTKGENPEDEIETVDGLNEQMNVAGTSDRRRNDLLKNCSGGNL